MNAPALIELRRQLRFENSQPKLDAAFWAFFWGCYESLPRIITDYDARISELTGGVVERLGEEE